MLVGGLAVNIYRYRRSIGDMYIFVEAHNENHIKLRSVHAEFGMHMGEMELEVFFIDNKKYAYLLLESVPFKRIV
jgi:hypothetical protein